MSTDKFLQEEGIRRIVRKTLGLRVILASGYSLRMGTRGFQVIVEVIPEQISARALQQARRVG